MARIARVVLPELPHLVTQQGNRRQTVFFSDGDYRRYIALMAEHCAAAGVEVWAWCLMRNHVHLVLVPSSEDALQDALSRAHRRYTLEVNRHQGWTGYLWQGRFSSTLMDELSTLLAIRYVEQNPVRARLCRRPEDWPWSSARTHLGLLTDPADDPLTADPDPLKSITNWAAFLADRPPSGGFDRLRQCCNTGRPFGDDQFVQWIETVTNRNLRPAKRGRPKKQETEKAS